MISRSVILYNIICLCKFLLRYSGSSGNAFLGCLTGVWEEEV